MRILVADDSPLVRQGVTRTLSNENGWIVCGEAIDGNEVAFKARELQPDLVLLDIRMPGLSGLEAARLLRQEIPAIKILIMSQYERRELLPRVLEAGADDCIDKAKLGTDLVPAVKALMNWH